MSSTTVAEFASELKKSTDTLLEQLRSAGVSKASAADSLSDADKQKLLGYLQASHGTASPERKKITLVKKSTSEIKQADATGIGTVVAQQFEVAAQILAAGLMPIVEPEVDIHCPDKPQAEALLKAALQKALGGLNDKALSQLARSLDELQVLAARESAAAFVQLVEALEHRRRHTAARSEVAPQAPAMRVVAAFAQVRAQQACRSVAREQAGQYKHRMAVALGGQPQQRPCRQRGRELMRGARLGPEKPARRG